MKRLTLLILMLTLTLTACGSNESSDSEFFSKERAIESSSKAESSATEQESSSDTEQKRWEGFDEFYSSLDPESRSAKNYAHNDELWKNSGIQGQLIEAGQDTEPQNELYLGNYKFGYNGCEIIASYNMLTLKGEQVDMAKLITEFERNALTAQDGSLGSDPRKINLLLDAHGYEYETLGSPADCDKALSDGKALIFAFYTGTPYFSGIHTVCITGGEDKFVLNRYNNIDARSKIDSVSELLKEEKCLIVAYALNA